MSEESRFFNHIDGDRAYNADEFAEYFRQVLTNGILNGGTNLQVYCDGTDRTVRINPGKAWLEGYFYSLTAELQLPLAEAHSTYDRIDRIVLRLDRNPEARHIKAFVLAGEPAMEPVAPALTREGLVYEVSLAQVLVVHNTSTVPAANVTDERLDSSVCGLVNSLVQVDAAHMTQQFESWFDTNTAQWQQEWETWFASIQGANYIPVAEKGAPGGVATYEHGHSNVTNATPGFMSAADKDALDRSLADYNTYKSGKDANGIFTVVDYKRADATLYVKSTLSNPDGAGNYQTMTIERYAADGTTLVETKTFALAYDADGDNTQVVKSS